MANSVDPPIGAVCTGSTLFASILNSSVNLSNYLQQTIFSDAFFLGALRIKPCLMKMLLFRSHKHNKKYKPKKIIDVNNKQRTNKKYVPALEIFVLIANVQKIPLTPLADVSRRARTLNFCQSLDLHPNFIYASSQGSGESAHLRRLA